MKKIDYNKRMLGKSALVKTSLGDRKVKVVRVVDEENFEVLGEEGEERFVVNIHDLRSMKNEPA